MPDRGVFGAIHTATDLAVVHHEYAPCQTPGIRPDAMAYGADNAHPVQYTEFSAANNTKQEYVSFLISNRNGTQAVLSFGKSTERNSGKTKRRHRLSSLRETRTGVGTDLTSKRRQWEV